MPSRESPSPWGERTSDQSVFLALKFAAPALAQSNPSKGKTLPGGSLILTASGQLSHARKDVRAESQWRVSRPTQARSHTQLAKLLSYLWLRRRRTSLSGRTSE